MAQKQTNRRKRKHPRLPNGYGSIKYLGKRRRNPYGVYPPVTEYTVMGSPKTPKAICYVDDWFKGFAVLTAYKAGTYTPGMEFELEIEDDKSLAIVTQKILADYNRIKEPLLEGKPDAKTFQEVYEEFYSYKFEREKSRDYSQSAKDSARAAFKNCAALHEKSFCDLRHADLQKIIDDCPLKHASKELIVSLLHQIYSYAVINDIVEKDYSAYLKIGTPDDDEHGEPFTEDDLRILWAHQDDETVEMLIIMCYSGFRITAYKSLEVNLKQRYFYGGIKTDAGKDRFVPIHSGILPLVKRRIRRQGELLPVTTVAFRGQMYRALKELEIKRHTPHDCRHTFSALCEKYSVNENDRKRMLGHSFGNDITNGIYGHRSLEELRVEIEKIEVPQICC